MNYGSFGMGCFALIVFVVVFIVCMIIGFAGPFLVVGCIVAGVVIALSSGLSGDNDNK